VELAKNAEALGVRTINNPTSRRRQHVGPNFAALPELLARCVPGDCLGGVSKLEDITKLAALAKKHAHLEG
jgi:hypothetical protein